MGAAADNGEAHNPASWGHDQVLGHGQRIFKSTPCTKSSISCRITFFFHSFSTRKPRQRYFTERCHKEATT